MVSASYPSRRPNPNPVGETANERAPNQFISVIPIPKSMGRLFKIAALVRHFCENNMLNIKEIRLDAAIRLS